MTERTKRSPSGALPSSASFGAGMSLDALKVDVQSGDQSVALLLTQATGADRRIRRDARASLASITDIASLNQLSEALMAEESAPVRESLATSLARLGWQPRTPAEKARFAVARRNISACIALGEAGRNELIETSTSSPKPSVRAEAALALAQVGGESAITAIVAALTDRKLHVRHAAALALQRLGWVPPSSELEDSLQAALHQTPPKAVAYVPDNPSVREVHLYVEGGASQALVDEIIRALHPEFLAMPRLKIFEHPVTDWPEEPFVLAAVDLRMHHRIRLTTDNCLTQNGSAYGKRLYLVMLT